MPNYDFKCKECSREFSVQVSIKEKSKTVCPHCGGKELQQLFKRVNLGGGMAGGNSCSTSCSSGSCSTCSGC
ncbi:MAG: zinc ribbon domain-containing protein [Clostridia bacterium]|nr:zinc ribbon domain-containing protein [Clostridia bacterium]